MSTPSKITLSVNAELRASHSLAGFETPHFHLWKIAVSFGAQFPLKSDRLIDLVFLQSTLNAFLAEAQGNYLNELFGFQPTSENLGAWIWEGLSKELSGALGDASLTGVGITLCDLDGRATGTAKLEA